MEFVTDDIAALAQPTDEQLSAYLKKHAETFRPQRQFSFSHVYLNPERHGENLARDAAQLLAHLQQAGDKADVAELGDSFLLEHKFHALPMNEAARQFGEKFAAKLSELSLNQWQGPVESGYGVHLVFLSDRPEGRVPALAEVRDAVRREWTNARRLETNEKFYQELLKRYVVTIERPKRDGETNRGSNGQMKRALLLLSSSPRLGPASPRHEVRPAYLELRQTAPDTYDALWKVPGREKTCVSDSTWSCPLAPRMSRHRALPWLTTPFTERWTVKCPGGLTGGTIHIAGLTATMTDVLVRLERLDGSAQVTRLTPSAPSFIVQAAPRAIQVAATYLKLGVEHILRGIDHLLFVLALLILVKRTRRLIATITAFTIAHSLTLAGATLGFVHVPGPPVEAAIALSIVFVASEIMHSRQGKAGLTERFPWVVAFTFGLLHGFGFAGALGAVGLPQTAIPVALLFFNVGVELGQLLFIASAFVVFALARRVMRSGGVSQPAWAWRIPPYAIGSIAMFWVIQRIAAF
jgi:hydrogenase/urease accessory protein HupE